MENVNYSVRNYLKPPSPFTSMTMMETEPTSEQTVWTFWKEFGEWIKGSASDEKVEPASQRRGICVSVSRLFACWRPNNLQLLCRVRLEQHGVLQHQSPNLLQWNNLQTKRVPPHTPLHSQRERYFNRADASYSMLTDENNIEAHVYCHKLTCHKLYFWLNMFRNVDVFLHFILSSFHSVYIFSK